MADKTIQAGFVGFSTNGKEFFEIFDELVEGAKEEILISVYTLRLDVVGREVLARLAHKVKQGVRVRIVFDALETHIYEKDSLAYCKKAGIEARSFRPLPGMLFSHPNKFFCRDHARIFLFDRKVLGVGGGGITKIYSVRNDFFGFVRLADPQPIVAYFEFLWKMAEASDGTPPSLEAASLDSIGKILASGPTRDEQHLYQWICEAVRGARRNIVVMAPFFIPPRELFKLLIDACNRGVQVDIITPLRTDKPHYDAFRALAAPRLLQHGARWWGTKKYFHQKLSVFDDRWSFGSANFDSIGLRRHFELNLAGEGGPALEQVLGVMEHARSEMRSITEFPAPIFYRKLSRVIYFALEKLFTYS